ncbi:zinc metalloproteinase-disintegrin-like atrase-A [Oryzias latipes]|uniref:ADAM metallopeptidase domain 8b n=1 Tax=Oryzias latipes TaxID=8090 RepID=H2MBI2_ORYLA|nr:zinc metalloproteinase-disintegrin-like atrase-A [Oryzias latipes]
MMGKVLPLCFLFACLVHGGLLLSHVQHYEVVRPQRRHDRHRRSLQDGQSYPDTVQYDLTIEGRNRTIHLEKNWNLIGRNYTETFYTEDGKRVTTAPNKEHCFYHGHIQGEEDSSVSVQICSGISGFLRAQQQLFLIEPLGQTMEEDHAVYRSEQLKRSSGQHSTCGLKRSAEDRKQQGPQPAALFMSRSRRSKSVPDPQKFVELVVVADNAEYSRHGKETRQRILLAVNHVDKLYRRLNIRIVLVGLEIWSYRDLINVDLKAGTTLDNFLSWRQSDLLLRVQHDNAQFVTGTDFETDTVGLANKFAMCTPNSGAVNQDHHENLIGLASTIAHEMGHNFGLSHDEDGCLCGSDDSSTDCVMTEKIKNGLFPEFFSSCSLRQLDEFMLRAQPSCLELPGSGSVKSIALGPRCGDAILDAGEECDCGTSEECNNACCEASTCRLTAGSQCAHGQCCENCQFKVTGSVCRKPASECDLPEYCTGDSQDCPEDAFEMNGKPCYTQTQGFCFDGRCPTREHHCWRLFGEGAKVGPDLCFNSNKKGEDGANCGRDRSGPIPCSAGNVKCGSMFCVNGGDSITGKLAVYNVFRFNLECRAAVEDDRSRNLDMVPNGATCGPKKICLNHRCEDISVYENREDCAKKCNNNGVCNHKNQCHCDPGWAPPYCDIRYADLPQGHTVVVAGVCAALSALLVVSVLAVGLWCRKRTLMDSHTRKRKAPSKLTPTFQGGARPQISQPTLMASTATQAHSPLVGAVTPSRAAPQPPKKVSSVPSSSETEATKPQPPSKPLPHLTKTLHKGAKPNPPPVPPVKPRPPAAGNMRPTFSPPQLPAMSRLQSFT